MERQTLAGLQAHFYEHPFDRSALSTLKGTPGLEDFIRKFNEYGIDRLFRVQYTGSSLKVTPYNLSEVHELFSEAARILNFEFVPDLYIQDGSHINAFTAGVEHPIVVLNSACIDHLSSEELLFILGHELGHIKSGHVLYRQMGAVFPMMSDLVGKFTLGLGALVSMGLRAALLNWQRMCELTADRAGLLTCQNRDASISAMAKMSGLPQKYYDRFNADDFVSQAQEFKALDNDLLDKVAKFICIMDATHPWTVVRVAEFDTWTQSGDYNRILQVCGSCLTDPDTAPRFCTQCGWALLGDETFCPACRHKLTAALSAAF